MERADSRQFFSSLIAAVQYRDIGDQLCWLRDVRGWPCLRYRHEGQC